MAQGLTFAEEISMTFYLSAEHFEREYFLRWQDYVIKPNNSNLEYYNEYVKPISIYQLGKNGERMSGLKLNECFPKTVGPVEFSSGNVEIGKQEVSFVFKDFVFLDGKGNVKQLTDDRTFPSKQNITVVNNPKPNTPPKTINPPTPPKIFSNAI